MDRLSAQDLMMLWPEELGWSQDIGALIVLDGRRLLDADGCFQIERVRDRVQERLQLVPRFRQLLYRPGFGMGWPVWSCGSGGWTGRGPCGRCGSCPACPMGGSACSCGCTIRSPTAWPASPH